jgi:CheY-like chemotaxis protein
MTLPEGLTPQSPELRERDARLRSQQRLAGRLAHDFNNYLSPIFGYLSLIKDEIPPEAPAHQYAVTMERGVRRTTQILERILLAAHPERRFMPAPSRFDQLLQRILQEWQSSLPPWSQIRVRTSLVPCQISADEELWQDALGQLLSNARFALSHGGELSVTLALKDLSASEAATLGVRRQPGAELVLQDNGPGMSEETLLYAMDPFYSTRPKNLAPGLGLSIVFGIVRLHGGQICLHSRPGEGTRTTLWIPCLSDPQTADSASPSPLAFPAAKILLADPDAIATETATTALQQARYQVQAASDIPGALLLFEKKPKNFALAILNAHLADPGCLELARRLRELKPGLPILFMSGTPETAEAIRAGGLTPPWRILTRPFKPAEILTHARKMISMESPDPGHRA